MIFPKSIKWQLILSILSLITLFSIASWISFNILNRIGHSNNLLVFEAIPAVHNGNQLAIVAQDMVILGHELERTKDLTILKDRYTRFNQIHDSMSSLISVLSEDNSEIDILGIHSINQQIRTLTNIVYQLKSKRLMQDDDNTNNKIDNYLIQLNKQTNILASLSTDYAKRMSSKARKQAVKVDAAYKQGRNIIIILFITTGLPILIIFWFYVIRRISNRLTILSRAITQQNTSLVHTQISIYGQDEISQMARAGESLLESRLVLLKDRDMLENRVTERTKELELEINERKQTEEELQKLLRAVESSSSIVMITDTDGNLEYVNPKFTDITGYSKEEAIGNNPRILKSGETLEEVYIDLWETITSGGEWRGEFNNRKKDGSFYRGRSSISAVRDANNDITHFIGIQDDVTHEYELTEQLNFQASHDALTGLINRHEFERRGERLLASIKQDKDEHALCYMDLDQFKVVNDTCGHAAGDEMLRQLSTVLQETVRHRDTLARLGGDEFGVLMEHCSLDDAHRVANSLLNAIQEYQFTWEEHNFKVGVSIGLVPITETTTNLTELLRDADAACYMAKDKGRNRIHIYYTEDSEIAKRHGEMQWVTRIQHALDEDKFCLYVQSIVPLDNSSNKHYELLIRMIDDKGETIPPGAFLPAAERYNLMTKLDYWVIEKAFSLLAEHKTFQNQISFISINLSGQSLADQNVLDFIITQLDESGIEGKKICFEITETAAISNLSIAMKFISTLRELGCRFALDDFGSGLSSFAYLKNLPVDYLKIDGMFVKDIVDDPIDHAMVKSINEIGQVMGMQTIAEFVENDEIKGMLREIGVNYAQGYGIDKPKHFDELLNRSNSESES